MSSRPPPKKCNLTFTNLSSFTVFLINIKHDSHRSTNPTMQNTLDLTISFQFNLAKLDIKFRISQIGKFPWSQGEKESNLWDHCPGSTLPYWDHPCLFIFWFLDMDQLDEALKIFVLVHFCFVNWKVHALNFFSIGWVLDSRREVFYSSRIHHCLPHRLHSVYYGIVSLSKNKQIWPPSTSCSTISIILLPTLHGYQQNNFDVWAIFTLS